LSGELIDGICDAVLWSPDARGRSAAIRSIVEEICESISWLHEAGSPDDSELASLRQLLAAAQAHQQRMDRCQLAKLEADLRATHEVAVG